MLVSNKINPKKSGNSDFIAADGTRFKIEIMEDDPSMAILYFYDEKNNSWKETARGPKNFIRNIHLPLELAQPWKGE